MRWLGGGMTGIPLSEGYLDGSGRWQDKQTVKVRSM
jgi:hypothetical protein